MKPCFNSSTVSKILWKHHHQQSQSSVSITNYIVVLQVIIWNHATSVAMGIPDFKEWGWYKDSSGNWLPYWTDLDNSSKAFSIRLQCGCMRFFLVIVSATRLVPQKQTKILLGGISLLFMFLI